MTKRTGVLYIATSPGGRSYVGITTCGIRNRWRDHVKAARRGDKTALNSAILKYGGSSFELRVLAVADWDYLNELEAKAIVAFGTLWPKGYNLRTGGSQFSPHEVSKAKQSVAMRGRTLTAEHKAKIKAAMNRPEIKLLCAASQIGRKHSEETRTKMSLAHRRSA